ncbi:MAG TPA: FG-GAP-like repeat-containing protein [Pyrinomonadaceae bacterium]|jgi:hypothetical protein
MKKKLLPAFLTFGIAVFAFGAYYSQKSNDFVLNRQSFENETREASESSEKPEPTDSNEAYLWRILAWKDQNGQIPANALNNSIAQRDQYLQQLAAPDGFSNGGVSRLNWVARGPKNVGGRTRSLIIHPGDSNTIWAGSVGGGVWKSIDAGTTWYAMNSNLQNLAVSSMAIDPNNPNVLYAGTGEGFLNADALRGGGIFKTTNGGMTWNLLGNTDPIVNPGWQSVDRISIARNNSNLILAATSNGIMRSTNGGSTWFPVGPNNQSLFVAFDPNDGSKAIAASGRSLSGNAAVYSTDGGATWTNANLDGNSFYSSGRVELAYSPSPSTSHIVYALFSPSVGSAVVARSTDGGHNFITRSTHSDTTFERLWYNNTLWVSPTDPDFIVAGAVNLFKSTNGGSSFTLIADGLIATVQPHDDNHCVVSDPGYNGNSNKRVYVCNDGGVYRTNDITTAFAAENGGWEQKYFTYQTTQYYGAAGNGTTRLIYGGAQDNGTMRLLPGEQNANVIPYGDGGFAAVDPTNDNYCYGESQWLAIHRSTNRGSTALFIADGITDATIGGANFIAPFILDPNDPNRMLAGGRSLWRTNNVKTGNQPTWTAIRPSGTNNISAIAVAQGDSNIIWIAQNDGKVYRTINGLDANPTWITVDDGFGTNPLPNRFVTRILIDKDNSNTVYVALGGFTGDNLWRTTNGGTNWQDITGTGLPNVPIRGIARHPNNSNKLYIGTEIGVFTTENGGSTWSVVIDGPTNVSVDELTFMSNSTILLAATHGRGIWTANVEITTPPNRVFHDFDGDGRSDMSVYRPSNGTWYLQRSSAGFQAQQWGNSTDKAVAADYDGDGKADITVWRATAGDWYRLNSSNGLFVSVHFGQNGDIPVPADYDGDGKADEAVFRPTTGAWYLNQSTNGFVAYQWGVQSDLPVTGDFDGDGKADLGVFRMVNGLWCLITSSLGVQYVSWGQNGDIPVAADYDGDGKADPAVFRATNGYGNWYLQRSSAGFFGIQWGLSTDKPVPGDYDGDGKADIAVWRPSDGTWYILQSSNGYRGEHFGANGDIPIPIR